MDNHSTDSFIEVVAVLIIIHSIYCNERDLGARRLGDSLAGLGHGSLPESVAETPADRLQVAHTASSGGLPPLGLDRPVVGAQLSRRVSALRAQVLLDVVR